MSTHSFLSPLPLLTTKPHIPPLLTTKTLTLSLSTPNLSFLSFKPLQFRPRYKLPASISADTEEEDDEEDDDDDDDEAAEEYDDVVDEVEVSEEEEEEDEESGGKFEEFKWQRVERIRNEVREFGDGIIDDNELASVYDFRIDKFQREAIRAFLRGSSVVVSAPTSSGKTLIAEAAAVATVAREKRIFYTTPLKALSNQKFREFRDTFGDENVGLLTGDSAINRDAPVIIMTTEILRNMLYQRRLGSTNILFTLLESIEGSDESGSVGSAVSESGLHNVDVIVLDEVHYLSDISRGTVWEEIVIYCPKEVQLICLSATVANPDELAGWIGQIHGHTELVTSSKRPVPLTWHFSTKTLLYPLLDGNGTGMNRKLALSFLGVHTSGIKPDKDEGSRRMLPRRRSRDIRSNADGLNLSKNDMNTIRRSQVPQVIDTLRHLYSRSMLPAVWFIFSRKGCDAAVQYVEDCKLLDECEVIEVELALKRFRLQYPDAVRELSVKGLLQGVAAHHAGCLPLWKAFVEDLFQRGLVKVVFATETLAAGINMPARTAVISTLSKRSQSGRIQLSPNELLQMAGRAGRRGIDEMGYVVLLQTTYEGAEECCKVLFSGLEPLVSQFTASYGMVLNLLAGGKVTRRPNESDDGQTSRAGRTLEEAKKLVEQSFGNYVGSNVMLSAKNELGKIEKEIELLNSEITDDAIDRKSRKLLSDRAYKEIAELQEELRAEKIIRTEARRKMEVERISAWRPILEKLDGGRLPFISLQYNDAEGVQHLVPAVYLGKADSLGSSKLDMFMVDVSSSDGHRPQLDDIEQQNDIEPSYYVALGSDNSWYLFTEKWLKAVYTTGLPNVALANGDALPRDIMTNLLDKGGMVWQKLADSRLGGVWCMEGSLETWSWSLNVPVSSSLPEDDEVVQSSPAYLTAIECYKDQRNKVSRLKKKISRTEGFREYKKILDKAKFIVEKIIRLKARSKRLSNRIEQIEPSGWKEFLKISNAIHEARALDINTNMLFPLGETAAAIRGENELWLAMVLRSNILRDLKPAQLAAVCGSLVSEGIKVRPYKNNNYVYEPSNIVQKVIDSLDEQRSSLLELQEKHGVEIPCCLDIQFAGMVEAWASGLTWREIMMDCAMDDGDLARLLRRTIDLLAQVPKLPDIDPLLKSNAVAASNVMDRPPISELAG